jgi:hypothetical protein
MRARFGEDARMLPFAPVSEKRTLLLAAFGTKAHRNCMASRLRADADRADAAHRRRRVL